MKPFHRVLLVALATFSTLGLKAQDTTAPLLGSISIAPAAVDISVSSQNITVTLVVTDDDSGFDFGSLQLRDGSGSFIDSYFFDTSPTYLQSGDNLNGTYAVTVTVPQFAAPGTWRFQVTLNDNASNRREYRPTGEIFPVPGDELFTVNNSGIVDSTPPGISLLSVSPASVDVSSGSDFITVEVQITDDLAGFGYGFIDLLDPSDNFSELFEFFDGNNRISGNALNGVYSVDIFIPQGTTPPGTWTLSFFIRDNVANSQTYDIFDLPGAFFDISSGGAATGSVEDAVDAVQYPVTFVGDADWFFQTSTTYDGIDAAQSGAIPDNGASDFEITVTGPGTLSFWWKVDSEENFDYLAVEVLGGGDYFEISGDVDWQQQTLIIPAGPQTISWSYFKDGSASAGADAGWVDRVYFAADVDSELPVIQRITVAPNPVDLSTTDQTVVVTIEVSDDNNGFDSGVIWFYDPVFNEYTNYFFNEWDRLSGDANFGTYEIILDLFQSDFFSEPFFEFGEWSIEVDLTELTTFNNVFYPGDVPFPNNGGVFTVTDTPVGDTQAPELASIDMITPDPADASGGPVTVTVEFQVTDDQSGFDQGFVLLYAPGGGFVEATFFSSSDLIAGDPGNGTYSVDVTVPLYAPPGNWELEFDFTDNAGNTRRYPFDSPFPNPGDELFTVTNTGVTDTQSPELVSFSLTPNAVDTTSSSQNIDVTLNYSDNLSGLDFVSVIVYDPNNSFISSLQINDSPGGLTSGTVSGTFTIPQGSLEGTWQCRVYMRDLVGNEQRYGIFGGDPFPVPGSELFTVGAVSTSTYDNFVSTYSLTGVDALPGSNPDKDWLINALELLLGTNPTVAEARNPALLDYSLTGNQLTLTFTVDPTLNIAPNGGFLDIWDATGTPFQLSGQTSNALASGWTNSLPVFVSGTTYTVTVTVGPGLKGFVRLNVVP